VRFGSELIRTENDHGNRQVRHQYTGGCILRAAMAVVPPKQTRPLSRPLRERR